MIIYILLDPRDDTEFRYIGATSEPAERRLHRHVLDSRHGQSYKQRRGRPTTGAAYQAAKASAALESARI